MQQKEDPHDFSDGAFARYAVDNAGVFDAALMECEEVGVVGEDQPPLAERECDVCFVGRREQAGVGSGGDVDRELPQAMAWSTCSSKWNRITGRRPAD